MQMKFNSNSGFTLWGQIKNDPTIFHVQIISPKYYGWKSGILSHMCLDGSGPNCNPNKLVGRSSSVLQVLFQRKLDKFHKNRV